MNDRLRSRGSFIPSIGGPIGGTLVRLSLPMSPQRRGILPSSSYSKSEACPGQRAFATDQLRFPVLFLLGIHLFGQGVTRVRQQARLQRKAHTLDCHPHREEAPAKTEPSHKIYGQGVIELGILLKSVEPSRGANHRSRTARPQKPRSTSQDSQ